MTKKILSIIIATVVLGGIIVAITRTSPRDTTSTQKEKVTIAEFGEVFIYAPLYIAQEKGFFNEEGLDVTIVPTGGDEKTFATLLSGDAQFGVADPTFTAISGERGQPGQVIASIVSGVPFWGIAKNTPVPEIKTPSELSTYSVATYPSPSTAYTLQKNMFDRGGLKPNIKETAFGSLLAALDANQIDIALELEPVVSTAVKNGARIVYAMPDHYGDFALTGITALPAYLNKHPETAQNVVNAIQKALTYIHNNPEGAAEVMNKRFPDIDPIIAKNAIQNLTKGNVIPKNALVSKAGWDAAIQLRVNAGDLKQNAKYETFVATHFAQQAK